MGVFVQRRADLVELMRMRKRQIETGRTMMWAARAYHRVARARAELNRRFPDSKDLIPSVRTAETHSRYLMERADDYEDWVWLDEEIDAYERQLEHVPERYRERLRLPAYEELEVDQADIQSACRFEEVDPDFEVRLVDSLDSADDVVGESEMA